MKKIHFCTVLVLSSLISGLLAGFAYAGINKETNSEISKIDVNNMKVIDANVTPLTSEDLVEGIPLKNDTSFDLSSLPKNLTEAPARDILKTKELTGDFETAQLTDVIEQEQTFYGIYPFYTAPGEYLQVQLDGPNSVDLDYDLYLFKFDMATGDLINTPIDVCAYKTTSLPLIPEAVGV